MTKVRLNVIENQRSEDLLIGSEALVYYVSKHFKLSPVEVSHWPIPEVERWAAWAGAADTHTKKEMDKEQHKVERQGSSARGIGGRY